MTESWMSGCEVLVTACSESLRYHRRGHYGMKEGMGLLPAAPHSVGAEPGAAALFSRALSAQAQTLAELLCCVLLQVTESFLSREVTCVVSSNREAKRGQAGARQEQQSSPNAGGTKSTGLVPAAPKGNPTRPCQKPPYTVRAAKVLAQGLCRVESGPSFGR